MGDTLRTWDRGGRWEAELEPPPPVGEAESSEDILRDDGDSSLGHPFSGPSSESTVILVSLATLRLVTPAPE